MKIKSLIILFLSAFISGISGIGWGLAGPARIALLPKEVSADNVLDKFEKIRSSDEMSLNILGKDHKKNAAETLKAFCLYSEHPDEHRVMIAFSRMKPSKFDFNPHIYTYGGSFIYPLGAWLKFCSVLKIITLTSHLEYYFSQPQEFGKIYLWARIFCVFVCSFLPVMIALTVYELSQNKNTAFLCGFLCIISPAFTVYAKYLSPHLYVQPFTALCIYFYLLYSRTNKTKYLYLSSCFSGISAGAVITTGFVFIFPIIAALKTRRFLSCSFTALISYLICNPYVPFSIPELLDEIAILQSWWKFTPTLKAIANLSFYLLPLSAGLGPLILCALSLKYAGKNTSELIIMAVYCFFGLYIAFQTGSAPGNPQLMRFSLPFLFFIFTVSHHAVFQFRLLYAAVLLWSFPVFFNIQVNFIRAEISSNLIQAGQWVEQNIPRGASVSVESSPAPYKCPPFDFTAYSLSTYEHAQNSDYIITGKNTGKTEKQFPSFTLIKEFRPFLLPQPFAFTPLFENCRVIILQNNMARPRSGEQNP